VASHVIGYIGRINQSEEARIAETEDAANYNGTDHIGKEGLEKSYEKQLHGITGYEEVEVSAGGRAVRTLSRTAGHARQQPDPVDRHRIAKGGRAGLRRTGAAR
jgi:penicillin-binding protein 2